MWQLCASVCAKSDMMDGKVQQRVCIDFCFCLGKIGAEMYEMLQTAFGESSINLDTKLIEDI
jgi:hypothetical protein